MWKRRQKGEEEKEKEEEGEEEEEEDAEEEAEEVETETDVAEKCHFSEPGCSYNAKAKPKANTKATTKANAKDKANKQKQPATATAHTTEAEGATHCEPADYLWKQLRPRNLTTTDSESRRRQLARLVRLADSRTVGSCHSKSMTFSLCGQGLQMET